ncbi:MULTISPECIES: helix-turn-helix transcriptional regulator [Aeromonas]|uniref:helix-turn-helix domain-containing protein n=1 Tax=Aeromonas TaxID=642 RepID=UPI002B060ECF|nr:helix-turn-helix transcriptional regulator [Aeromonas jandaei]
MRSSSTVAQSLLVDIKRHLRSIFDDHNLSYSSVARLLNVDRATVRRWLRDDDPTSIDLLGMAELSYHLGIPIQHLLPLTPWGGEEQQIYGFEEQDRALLIDLITRIKADYQPKKTRRRK